MSPASSYDRSNNLQRGSACITCRRRKMRCDGAHPVCGQCQRGDRSEDCEYAEGDAPTQSQILEDNISRLEARVLELQTAQRPLPSVRLHQPYGPHGSQSPPAALPNMPTAAAAAQEPPLHIRQKILDSFLPYASELGFFLHVQKFATMVRQTAAAPGHPSRPAPALLFAVYLFGIRLSGDAAVMANEPAYLARAVQEAAVNLSSDHPQRIMHGIQADVLLANYFLSKGRLSEAKYYITSSVSTAVAAGLHKIRSRHASSLAANVPQLPPPRDAIDEGERILGAWTVFILDKSWAAIFKESSNLVTPPDRPDSWIDTPWPMDMSDYEQGRLPAGVKTDRTVLKFLNSEPTSDAGQSSLALLAKATFIWEKASELAQQYQTPAMAPQQYTLLSSQMARLDGVLEKLKAGLPALDQFARVPSPEKARRLVVFASVIHMATICLHSVVPNDVSRRKSLSSAQAILDIVTCVNPRHLCLLNPIIGSIWVEASQNILNEVTALRSLNPQQSREGSERQKSLLYGLQAGIDAMSSISQNCSLTRFQTNRIQQAFNATFNATAKGI